MTCEFKTGNFAPLPCVFLIYCLPVLENSMCVMIYGPHVAGVYPLVQCLWFCINTYHRMSRVLPTQRVRQVLCHP